jgi:hypothetical protein
MTKENIINGEHVNFDVTGVRVTKYLLEALTILDRFWGDLGHLPGRPEDRCDPDRWSL